MPLNLKNPRYFIITLLAFVVIYVLMAQQKGIVTENSPFLETNSQRRNSIRQQCNRLASSQQTLDWSNWNNNRSFAVRYNKWFKRLVVSEPLKLVFCPIFKGAYTNVINYLSNIDSILAKQASGLDTGFEDYDRIEAQLKITEQFHHQFAYNASRSLNFFSSYPLEKAREILASYKKMIFVRNPIHRFVSAWQDKFSIAEKQSDMVRIANEIFNRYASGAGRKGETSIVKFEEFTRYVYDEPDADRMDRHWMPQWKFCAVCQIDYDYVGHAENLSEEFNLFLNELTDHRYEFPPMPKSSSPSNRTERQFILYNVDKFHYFVEALRKHYREDFEIFGYPKPY